jgi:integrase
MVVGFTWSQRAISGTERPSSNHCIAKARRSVRHLYNFFGNAKARDLTATKVEDFIYAQHKKGYSNAEINRQTAALKRMFNLAMQSGRLFSKPYIPHLTEDNIRTGFFEEDAFRAVLTELAVPIQPVAVFAYYLGWRRREITTLTWAQIDFKEKTVRLEVGTIKKQTWTARSLP